MATEAVTPQDLQALVQAARLAPSGDNCQPWRFAWDGRTLTIRFVPERAASLYDVRCLASWVSLGAVLVNLRIAAAARGLRSTVTLFPNGPDSERVARVALEPGASQGHPLAEALSSRCVNRRPYAVTPLTSDDRRALEDTRRDAPDVRLDLVDAPGGIRHLAGAIALNERLLFENRALHDGLFRWLRWSAHDIRASADGMPIGSLELGPIERPGFRALGAWPLAATFAGLGLTRTLPLRTRAIYQRSAAIGLLSVANGHAEAFVQGGQALESLWLTATIRGVAFQPIAGVSFLWLRCRLAGGEGVSAGHRQAIEAAAHEIGRVAPAFLERTPVMLFRVGYAPPPSDRAIRRPVEHLLTVEAR